MTTNICMEGCDRKERNEETQGTILLIYQGGEDVNSRLT